MSERIERFDVGDEPRLSVSLPAGSVRVVAGDDGVVEVTARGRDLDDLVIEQRGDVVYVAFERNWTGWNRSPIDVVAAVPVGTAEVQAKLAAADLDVDVDVARLEASLSSGDVRAQDVRESVQVKVASGDLRVGTVGGRLEVSGASGDVEAVAAAEVDISLAAGDVGIGRVDGRARVNTAAGDVRIGHVGGRSCECKTVSGDVRLGIPEGRVLEVDVKTLSGDVRSELRPGASGVERIPASVKVKSMAGDVVFVPAD